MKMNEISKRLSTRCCYIIIVISSFITSLCASNNPFTIGNSNTDSSVFTYVSNIILKGGMPYRDTFDHKGPLIYLINALGLLINKNLGIWLTELVTIFIILYFSFKISRLLGCDNLKSIIVTIICVLTLAGYYNGGNSTEEYACALIIISLYIFIKYFEKSEITGLEIFLCGFCFGGVVLLKINMASLWGIMCLGVLIKNIKEKTIKKLIGYIIWFLIGSISILLPVLIWLICGNAFDAFIYDYLTFNFAYSSAIKSSLFAVVEAFYYFIMTGPVLLSIPILVFNIFKEKTITDVLCLFCILLSLAMVSISGRAQEANHYGLIFCPLTIYAASRFFSIMSKKDSKSVKPFYISAVSLLLITFMYNFAYFFIPIGSSVLNVKSSYYEDMRKVSDIIIQNTDKSDKISVCGNRDLIYLLSERESASIYSYQYPIIEYDSKIKDEYISDISKLEAEIIVINNSDSVHTVLEDILNKHYKMIDSVSSLCVYKINH